MRPFHSTALRSLTRPPLAKRFANRHVRKQTVSNSRSSLPSRPLSTTRSLRNPHDQPGQVIVTTRTFPYWPRPRFWNGVIYALWVVIIARYVLRRMSSEEEEEVLEEELLEPLGDGESESLFIALQYPRRLPLKRYQGNDPEVLEIEKFSRNGLQRQTIERDLSEHVRRHCAGSTMLGQDVKISRTWFEVAFSATPPPEYSRTGIEITDEYVALASQVIPHERYIEISNVLWPKALAMATYTSIRFVLWTYETRLKQLCGLELNNHEQLLLGGLQKAKIVKETSKMQFASEKEKQDEVRSRYTEFLKEMRARNQGRDPPQEKPAAKSNETSDSELADRPSKKAWTLFKCRYNGTALSYILSLLPPIPVPVLDVVLGPLLTSIDLQVALQAFGSSLAHSREEAKLRYPPRGMCLMSGLVDVTGSERGLKVAVTAIVDPKEGQVKEVVRMQAQPMSFIQWRQHRLKPSQAKRDSSVSDEK